MSNPLVSVIVPVHNAGRYLADALQSVIAQDHRPLETIVVDDGSTDDSPDVARSFAGMRCIYQTNQGPAAARNSGIAVASGEFLAFLDADDIWAPDKLSRQLAWRTPRSATSSLG